MDVVTEENPGSEDAHNAKIEARKQELMQSSLLERYFPRPVRMLRAFINLLSFLIALALIATTMYVSILAMPAISASLVMSLGLAALPQAAITIISILPVIVSAAIFLRFLQIHGKIKAKREEDLGQRLSIIGFMRALLSWKLPNYPVELVERAFLLKLEDETASPRKTEDREAIELTKERTSPTAQKWRNHFHRYHAIAGLTALGLGIYLAVYVTPFLMTAVMGLGVPFPLTVLFGAVAAVTLIAITYQLLALVIRLRNVGLQWDKLSKDQNYDLYHILSISGAAVALVFSAGAVYAFFPLLVHALAPVLTQGLATFTAVAVSVSLALVMMRLVPEIMKGIGKGVKSVYDKNAARPSLRHSLQRRWKGGSPVGDEGLAMLLTDDEALRTERNPEGRVNAETILPAAAPTAVETETKIPVTARPSENIRPAPGGEAREDDGRSTGFWSRLRFPNINFPSFRRQTGPGAEVVLEAFDTEAEPRDRLSSAT